MASVYMDLFETHIKKLSFSVIIDMSGLFVHYPCKEAVKRGPKRWLSGKSVRPVSGSSWVRSPTASYQRRLKMILDVSLLSADRYMASLSSQTSFKNMTWITSGMSGRE